MTLPVSASRAFAGAMLTARQMALFECTWHHRTVYQCSPAELAAAACTPSVHCAACYAMPQFFSFPKFPEAEHHHLKIPWTYPEADHYLSALQDSMMPRIFGTQYVACMSYAHTARSPALPAELTRWLLCLALCPLSSTASRA